MSDRDQLLVPGEVDHIRALRVLIDATRCLALAEEIDRRPLVALRPPEHGEAGAKDEARAVGGLEVRRKGRTFAAAEWLSHVAAELIAFDVVEPPDVLSRRVDTARDAITGPLRAIRDLPVRSDQPVPGVDLQASPDVGEIEQVVRIVSRPE